MGEPFIETERLLLRRPQESDFEAWARAFADAQFNRYMMGEALDRGRAWRSLAATVGHWELRGFGFFSVLDKNSGAWLGRVGPWYPEDWPEPEVGWAIAPWAQRNGYAVEAGAASIEFAFERLGWSRVIHLILDGNTPSMRTAEALGSRREREIASPVGEGRAFIYAQSRDEWRKRRRG